MEAVAIICRFLGAWFLVAGPIYQAALELREQDIEHERLRAIGKNITPPKPISAWWWLLPPVRVLLERRRIRRYRKLYFEALSYEDLESFMVFVHKATAWLLVGLGGFLVAISETYDLIEHYHWSLAVFGGLVAAGLLLSIGNTIGRIGRSDSMLESKVEL